MGFTFGFVLLCCVSDLVGLWFGLRFSFVRDFAGLNIFVVLKWDGFEFWFVCAGLEIWFGLQIWLGWRFFRDLFQLEI